MLLNPKKSKIQKYGSQSKIQPHSKSFNLRNFLVHKCVQFCNINKNLFIISLNIGDFPFRSLPRLVLDFYYTMNWMCAGKVFKNLKHSNLIKSCTTKYKHVCVCVYVFQHANENAFAINFSLFKIKSFFFHYFFPWSIV